MQPKWPSQCSVNVPAFSYGHAKLLAARVSKVSWTYLSPSKHCTHHHQAERHSAVSHRTWRSRALSPLWTQPSCLILPLFFLVKAKEFIVATKWLLSFRACPVSCLTVALQTDRRCDTFWSPVPFAQTHHIYSHLVFKYFRLHARLRSLPTSIRRYSNKRWPLISTQKNVFWCGANI